MRLTATLRPRGGGEIAAMLTGLALADFLQIRQGVPVFSQSEVRYRREPRGAENWRTAREIVARGWGDCEDLAAYLVASAWIKFVADGDDLHRAMGRARVAITRTGPGTLHAIAKIDGRIVDPSRARGM